MFIGMTSGFLAEVFTVIERRAVHYGGETEDS
jgi:hypothetical protein